ncbi:MAG TPA: NAD(P)/FAD-dependent oxidoreductase [Actinomycetota bacterium]|nr:NAD(P)/FAD-dependent oxidoreductase [Actinomycetota bacterium]
MSQPNGSYDAIVVGAGHNGLVCGAYLAKAGLNTIILERREAAGGAVATSELSPGVRAPTVAHSIGRLRPSVIRDLKLQEHGLALLRPDVRMFAPQPDGRAVTLWADPRRTGHELREWSPNDANGYIEFDRKVQVLGSFLAHLDETTPPDLRSPAFGDALAGLKLLRAYRRLGKKSSREVLRVLPMAVADFVTEAFETDAVRAAVAARGVQFTAMGPRSPGTAAVLLADSSSGGGAAGALTIARGGPGALAEALAGAARSFGATVREGSEVKRVVTAEGRVTGVVLDGGEVMEAPIVVAGMDPKQVLLRLLDPGVLGPTLVWKAQNLRLPGVVAKVNLALSGIPRFLGNEGDGDARLQGRIVIAPGLDYLERAFDASKYGGVSESPYLEATIPTLLDPTLAPEGTHVMSVVVQYAPYHLRNAQWNDRAESLSDLVLRTLEPHAPGVSNLVTAAQVITPVDLERIYGMTEGHPLHGEPSLDQFFAWRPLLGHARYRLAVEGLYLCGAGAHPGGGVTGGPGQNAAREILKDRKRRGRVRH